MKKEAKITPAPASSLASDAALTTKTHLLIFFTALSAGTLLLSNIAAVKLWDFFGIAVDGGIIIFPITYILGDLIIELFGQKIANRVILSSFIVNIIATLALWVVITLPAYPNWDLQDSFSAVLGFTPRIIFASLLGYISSNLLNNYVFEKLRNFKQNINTSAPASHTSTSPTPTPSSALLKLRLRHFFSQHFIARALGSSVFAHFVDSLIFETLAFFGVLSFSEFVAQVLFAYVAGLLIEVILSPLENLILRRIKCSLSKL